MNRFAALLIALAGLFTTPCLEAQGMFPYLADTPFSRFSDEDLSLFQEAQKEALERRADGSVVSWQNPETGASGTVTPIQTRQREDRECRQLRVVNRAGDEKGESRFWFCRMPDAQWKIESPE